MRYELSISKNYVQGWDFWEAVRELSQNAMDNEDFTGEKVFIGKEGSDFIVRTRNTTIDVDTLVLGNTTKTGSERGAFGEGYKLALVVLLRNGFDVQIHNGADIWNPSFVYSEKFNTEILVIDVEKDVLKNEDLSFIIKNVEKEHIDTIKNKIVAPTKGDIETSHGWILVNKEMKGKIYCGNLYVCDSPEELTAGYNFHPDSIELGRDRHLVSSFNIKWLSSQMWAEVGKSTSSTEHLKTISKMIAKGYNDTQYIGNHYDGNILADIVADAFYEGYSDKHYPVTSVSSIREIVLKYVDAKPVLVDEQVAQMVKKSNRFKKNKNNLTKRVLDTPHSQMIEMFESIKHDLHPDTEEILSTMVDRAEYWLNDTESIMDKLVEESR